MEGDWRALHRINTAISFLSMTLGPCMMLNGEEEEREEGEGEGRRRLSFRCSETTGCQRVRYPYQWPQRIVK